MCLSANFSLAVQFVASVFELSDRESPCNNYKLLKFMAQCSAAHYLLLAGLIVPVGRHRRPPSLIAQLVHD